MIIYNITYCIDAPLIKEWNEFVEQSLIPFFTEHAAISDFSYFKVLTVEEGASPTFCFQLFMKNINDVKIFKETEASLKSMVFLKFQDSCLSFETVLKKL